MIKIFISYHQKDKKYLREDSLLGFVKNLKREGVELWTDQEIQAGANRDDEIRAQIQQADIALVLISQVYLNSCEDELERLIKRKRETGLIIVPVILSPCDWHHEKWLRRQETLPRNDKTIETHYTGEGERKGVFQEILDQLRQHVGSDRTGNGGAAVPADGPSDPDPRRSSRRCGLPEGRPRRTGPRNG